MILDFIGDKCTAAVTADRYAGDTFTDPEGRQICWAHLLRDFSRIGQRQGLAGQIGRRLLGLGLVMFRKRDRGQLGGQTLDGLQRRIRMALQRGAQQARCTRTANTCATILKLWPALWSFTTNDNPCLRQGVDLWDFMHKAVHVFIANTAPPSLVPRTGSPVAIPTG